jgi:SAM-dependent methyltransferase
MQPSAPSFDPAKYKQTTREQWQSAAQAWHRWGPTLDKWLNPATETMLEMARIGPGGRVLDVAAGAGGQTLLAAARVGPSGSILATDISSNILDFAAKEARRHGFANVTTQVADGENLEVEPHSFDAVISRVGLIYFPDQQAALRSMLGALKPGGRVAAMVYSTADKNGFFSVPVSIIRNRAQLPPPVPGQPGPFSLGGVGILEKAFESAGFHHAEVRAIQAPLRMKSAAECLRFERESFGALHQMLSGLDEPGREAAWAEIEDALGKFERPDGFAGPCELLIGVGVA